MQPRPLFLLLAVLPTLTIAKTWTVYYPHQFAKNDLCAVLDCGEDELCIVNENNAVCVHKHKLHEVEGEHVDFGTGKKIEHSEKERNHYKAGHKRSNHKHAHQPRHYEHNEDINSDCDEKELHKMGGRLLQWFTEIHKSSGADQELPLHKHKTVCRNDVSWMFQQWDGNNDGELSVKELIPLETDANEKCLKAFIDRCDTEAGNDDVITLDEWCDCFSWADDDRHEPPCHAAKHITDPHLIGAFHPHCTIEGYYKSEQCHENECWCVDKYGREFDKSRVKGNLPDCGQYSTDMDKEEERELTSEL